MQDNKSQDWVLKLDLSQMGNNQAILNTALFFLNNESLPL